MSSDPYPLGTMGGGARVAEGVGVGVGAGAMPPLEELLELSPNPSSDCASLVL